MNAGHFEQISDCWSPEEQPATYYRTTAARARKLQADAATPRVKVSRHDDCSLRTVGGQSRAGHPPLSIGDHREIRGLYDWAEVVEIDAQELLIIGR